MDIIEIKQGRQGGWEESSRGSPDIRLFSIPFVLWRFLPSPCYHSHAAEKRVRSEIFRLLEAKCWFHSKGFDDLEDFINYFILVRSIHKNYGFELLDCCYACIFFSFKLC